MQSISIFDLYVSTATLKRPVPLEHSLFYGNKLFPICQGDKYISDGLQKAKAEYQKKNKMGPSDRDYASGDAQGEIEHNHFLLLLHHQ